MKASNTSERLKQLMHENNLRQIDILNKCQPYCQEYGVKIGRNDLSQYVNNKVEPGQEKLSILSHALNVNEVWLMGYDVPRERNCFIVTDHSGFDDDILMAISIIAKKSGYDFSLFAKSYQISRNDFICKLSPKEVNDYAKSAVEQIRFVTDAIIKNKLKDNSFSISDDLPIDNNVYDEPNEHSNSPVLRAAHERTDIEVTDEMRKHDDDIMNDEDF